MGKKLSSRINSLIIVISITISFIFFGIIFNLNGLSQDRELSQIHYFLDTLLFYKKEMLSNQIYLDQREALSETLREFVENEHIMTGYVYSLDGKLLAKSGDEVESFDFEDMDGFGFRKTKIGEKNIALYTEKINVGEESFGYIRFYYDITHIVDHNTNLAVLILFLLALETAVLILMLNLRLKKVIVEPIQILEQNMQSVIKGDFQSGVLKSDIYEIDRMQNTFNKMSKSLKESHDNLEELVKDRTKELMDSQKRLRIIIDTVPTPLFYKDKYSRYIGCNNKFADMVGKKKEDIIGKRIFDLTDIDYAKPIYGEEIKMLKSPESQSYEGRFKTVYGVKDVIVNKASIVSETGEIEGLVAVMSDITNIKDMEKEIKYDAKFQELIADISSSFISVDKRNTDEKIMSMLTSAGEFFDVDRAFLYREIERDTYRNTHEWCGDMVSPSLGMDLSREKYPYLIDKIRGKEPFCINNLDEYPKDLTFERNMFHKHMVKSCLVVPIIMNGNVEGALGLSMINSERYWQKKEISLLKLVTNVLVDALERKHMEDRLESSNRELKKLSTTDKLTQLNNRLKTDEVLEKELIHTKRKKDNFSLILLDIDHFKSINDNYGHQVGDDILVEISNTLKDTLRKTDTIGRWGGEEFMSILPETDLQGAIIAAEKIRKAIDEHKFKLVGSVTCSLGVSESKKNDTGNSIVARADSALYRAKENGRNRVEFK